MPDASETCWLLLDVGNTRAKAALGRLPGGELISLASCATAELLGSDPATRLRIWALAARDVAESRPLDGCVWSAVVPAATRILRDLLTHETLLSCPIRSVEVRLDLDLGVQLELANPNTVGADRLASLAGAAALAAGYRIVVDAGTAVTVDGLDPAGIFRGGAIAPGLELGAAALHQRTAQLPLVSTQPEPWPPARGRTTAEALRAGLLRGFIGMVERLVHDQLHAWDEPAETTIFLTGGQGELLAQRLDPARLGHRPATLRAVPNLTLTGLLAIAARQRR